MASLTTLLQLGLSFARIGLAAFGGGISTLPLIQHELVSRNGWITEDGFTQIIALAQVTPGPIAINAATFIGFEKAGIVGSFVATGALVGAPLLLLSLLLLILKNCDEKRAAAFKRSMRPIVAALLTLALFPPLLSTWQNGPLALMLFCIGIILITRVRFFRSNPLAMFLLFGLLGAFLLR